MRICSIASGSSGNCIYVGDEHTHVPVSYTHLATDENTLEIQLVHPASYFLELVAGSVYPVNESKYEEFGSDYGTAPVSYTHLDSGTGRTRDLCPELRICRRASVFPGI